MITFYLIDWMSEYRSRGVWYIPNLDSGWVSGGMLVHLIILVCVWDDGQFSFFRF